MDLDKLAAQFPRSFRLIANRNISVGKGNDAVTDHPGNDDGRVCLVPTDGLPTVQIGLQELELALTGFRDTGTWGDCFPPVDTSEENPRLTYPSRPGRARYHIDTD